MTSGHPEASNDPAAEPAGDAAWLAVLRRRPAAPPAAAGIERAAQAEAAVLSRALDAERAAAEQRLGERLGPAASEHAVERLLFAASREPLFDAAPKAPPAATGWQRYRRPAGFALAAALALGVALPLLQPPEAVYDEPPAWRGGAAEVQLRAPSPRSRAEALSQRLQAAGARVFIYQEGRDFVLDVDVPAAARAQVDPVLQGEGLPTAAAPLRLRILR